MSSRKGSRFDRMRATRIAAMQAAFQMQARDQSAQEVTEEFILSSMAFKESPHEIQLDFFKSLIQTLFLRHTQVEELLAAYLSETWPRERLDTVLVAVLQVGISELLSRPMDVPTPVIISEYVAIAQGFTSPKEAKFINAHLDLVAKSLALLS